MTGTGSGGIALSTSSTDDIKRVRVDTGPLGHGVDLVGASERVWPWYASGVAMLVAAAIVGAWNFEAAASTTSLTASALGFEDAPTTPPRLASEPVPVPPPRVLAPASQAPPKPVVAMAPAPDRELAKSLNAKGYAARKRGDHSAARALYKEATDADPYHVWSRFNLACELALQGKRQEALSLLEAVRAIGGDDAERALTEHAPTDPDLATLYRDQRFRKLTAQRR